MDDIFVNIYLNGSFTNNSYRVHATLQEMSRSVYVQLFSEFFPILAFFIAGQLTTFYIAAVVLIFTTLIAFITSFLRFRTLPVMPLFSGSIVFFFGGLTLFYDQPGYLIFADTVYYFSLALLVLLGFWQKRHLLEYMFEHTFAMQPVGWRILSIRWFIVLCLAGTANEFARYFLEPEVWIDYRFFKVLLLMGFAFYQFTLSKKYRIPKQSNHLGLRVHE